MQRKSFFYLLGVFHLGSVLIGMTLTSRMVLLNFSGNSETFRVTGGIFFIPVVFFIQDIVTEIYGYYNARKMLNATLIIFILYVFILYLISLFPCYNGNKICENLSAIARTLPRHALSFLLALAAGGTINNYLLAKMKVIFNDKFLAIRFISSTAIGEGVFQILAVLISWYGTYSIVDILPLAFASYLYKLLFEVFSTPANLYICRYLKKIDREEPRYVKC